MQKYRYTAYDMYGRKCRGKKEFSDEREFRKFLKKKKMVLIQFDIVKSRKKISKTDILCFTRELKIMLESRISIIVALEIQGEQYKENSFGTVIVEIKEEILNGSSIGDAFKKYRDIFGNFYVDLLHLGEISGKITENLERISANLELEGKLRKKIAEAFFYPCIVIIFSMIVVMFMMIYVLPNFVEMFNESGTSLPILTQVLMLISKNMYYIVFIAICIWILIIHFKKRIKSNMNRRIKYDKFIMKIPIYKIILEKSMVIRFSKNMALMMESGMLVTEILEFMKDSFENTVVKKEMEEMKYKIISGEGIAQSLKCLNIYSERYRKMVIIGEESGELTNMFHKISQLCQEELEGYIGKMLVLLEPVLIIILGLILGTVIIAIYLPIFNMSDLIK